MTKSTLLVLLVLSSSLVATSDAAESTPPVGPYISEWIHSFNRCEVWQGKFLSEEEAMAVGAEKYYEKGCGHEIIDRSGWGSEDNQQPGPCGSTVYYPPNGINHFFGLETRNMQKIRVRYGNPNSHCQSTPTDSLTITRVRSVFCPDGYDRVGARCSVRSNELIRPKNNNVCDSGLNDTNPISIGSGFKLQRDVDSQLFGFEEFSRFYSSNPAFPSGRLGKQWRHSFDRRISIHQTQDGRTSLWAARPNGNLYPFVVHDGQVYHDPDLRLRLTALDGDDFAWLIVTAEGEQEFYDQDGLLKRLVRRDGRRLELIYDQYALIALADESGRRVQFEYSSEALLTAVVQPGGGRLVYTYTAAGLLEDVSLEDASGVLPVVRYGYEDPDRPHLLTAKFDALGKRIGSWAYDGNERAYLSTAGALDSTVGRAEVHYGEGSARVTGPLGNDTDYDLSLLHGVARITRASSSCLTCGGTSGAIGYDDNGFVAWREDLKGVRTTFVNNDRGLAEVRVDAQGEPESRTILTDWHPVLPLPLSRGIQDATGDLIAEFGWEYDESGRTVAHWVNDLEGGPPRKSEWRYCEATDVNPDSPQCPRAGLLMLSWAPGQDEHTATRYTYFTASDESGCATAGACHRAGDLRHIENPLGHRIEILGYDASGRVAAIRDANGVETRFDYHPRGWLTGRSVLATDGSEPAVSTIHYLDNGLVESVELPGSAPIRFIHDDHQRLVATDGGALGRMDFVLDAAGNRIEESISDEEGGRRLELSRTINALGQLETWADALSNPTDFRYDANGNLIARVRPDQSETEFRRDPLGRLKEQVSDVTGIEATVSIKYDALDRIVEVVDPKGLSTEYHFNSLGDLVGLSSPDTGSTSFAYDETGRMRSQVDARGQELEVEHDVLGRVTRLSGRNESSESGFHYDEPDQVTGCLASHPIGRLTRQTESFGESRWCYDHLGGPTRVSQAIGAVTLTTGYGYDAAGRLEEVQYPSGAVVHYGRDASGRIVSVTQVEQSGDPWNIVVGEAEHLPFGPVSRIAYGNGAVQERHFDLNYRPIGLSGAGGDFVLEPDEVGNITSISAVSDGEERRYRYDALGRLEEVSDGLDAHLTSYSYDETGNRLSRTDNGITELYDYPADSHLLRSINGRIRQHDASGNLSSFDGLMFKHGTRSRLEGALRTRPRTSIRNFHNGFGQRVRKTGTDGERLFVYNLAGQLLGEYDAAGHPIQEFIWMDNLPVGVMVHRGGDYSGQVMAIYSDHLGTPRAIAGQNGEVLWRWSLMGEPFGDHQPDEDVNGDGVRVTFNLRFPGQYFDRETLLHYNYFRDYDPTVGRYVQSDPIGLAGGVSTFAYGSSSPLLRVDPLGLVDILLLHPTDPLVAGFNTIESAAGEVTFGGHADPERFLDQRSSKRGKFMFAREVASLISGFVDANPERFPNGLAGITVKLYACRTGVAPEGGRSLADQVARILGNDVFVWAPDSYVWIDAVGGYSGVFAKDAQNNLDVTNRGEWGLFGGPDRCAPCSY